MKPLIISLAINGRENYIEKQRGLIKTLPVAGDVDTWILNEYPKGVTPHSEVPYLFKFDLIKKANDDGYTKICWTDSTMRFLKNPFELLELSEKGVVAFDNLGHPAWKYTTDIAATNLSNTYWDEEEFKSIKQTWGGLLMFDFEKSFPHTIMSQIFKQASMGSFDNGSSDREGFVAARHDQTVLSFLFHHYKIQLLEYGIIAAKKDVTDKTYIQYGN